MSEKTPQSGQEETTRIVAGAKTRRKIRGIEIVAIAALVALIGAGAAVATVTANNKKSSAPVVAGTPAAALKLGYFPNVTHAPALIGVNEGIFARNLGTTQPLDPGIQRRPVSHRGPERRGHRRRLPWPQPGHQLVREKWR